MMTTEGGHPHLEEGGTATTGPFTGRHLCWMLVFTIVGAALRLSCLGDWAFWVDEAHTFRDVIAPMDEFWASGTSKYPLSFLVVRSLAGVCGMAPGDLTEEFMRLPFAFFGIASIPTLAIVARGMVGTPAALLAALFLALSPWHIYWSQNARSYSMVLFFCLVASGAAYYGFRRRSWWMLLTSVAFFFLGGFSHPSAFVVVAAALLYLLLVMILQISKGGAFAKWGALAILVSMLLMVLVLQPVVERMLEVKDAKFSLFHLIQTLVFYVGVPVLIAAVGGMLHLFDRQSPAATFLAVMFVVPLVGLSVVSTVGVQTVSAQYAFATLPAIYILAATLIMALGRVFAGTDTRSLALKMVPLAMIIFHMLGQDYLYYIKEYGWRPRWKEAVHYVEGYPPASGRAHTRILTTNAPSVRYYVDPSDFRADKQRGNTIRVVGISLYNLGRSSPEEFLSEQIRLAKAQDENLWVIVTEPELEEMDIDGRANAFFRRQFRQIRRLPNWTGPKDMDVLVYYYDDKSR